MSEPEPNADGKKIYHPRGKVLGGSSSINLMAYVRGNAADYDHWRQLGLASWGYDDVLPYFKRAENFQDGGDFYHGSQGPLRVSRPNLGDNIFKAFIEAGVAAGYPLTSDYNGANQEGFGQTQLTIHKGRRCSASTAYLHPIMARSNLSVKTGAFVTSILFDGNRAIGIEYIKDGKPITVRAERELILSGGAINSPQIMMLSGIGPTDHLEKLNIKPRFHHPHVLANALTGTEPEWSVGIVGARLFCLRGKVLGIEGVWVGSPILLFGLNIRNQRDHKGLPFDLVAPHLAIFIRLPKE